MKKTVRKGPRPWAEISKHSIEKPRIRKNYDSFMLELQILDLFIKRRIFLKLTQKKLAKKAGLYQSAIARFEAGTYSPTLVTIQKIATALKLDLQITAQPQVSRPIPKLPIVA